jgi:phosphate:Na+ symporter
MVVMTRGLETLAGSRLRKVLAEFTKSPVSGAATGAGATIVVQSSSATTVAAVGFVSAGLLTFPQALGIIFGANIGTTVTGWIVAIFGFKLKIAVFAPPLVLLGVLLHLFSKRRLAAIGFAVAGLGLLFVGISTLQTGMAGLKGVVTPDSFPGDHFTGRLLLVGIGALITLVTQSSSAGVATALTAVNTGTITFPQAAAMVIGMDVATTVTAAIATLGGSTDTKRTGYAHVIYNVLTGIGAFFLLYGYTGAVDAVAPGALIRNPEIALVGFHTLFNGLGVLIVLPFTHQFAALIVRLVPDRPVRFTQRLGTNLYRTPAVAIEAVRATLKELSGEVFSQLIGELNQGVAESNLATILETNEALRQTREYLEPIDTSRDHQTLFPRHLSSIHIIDHLRRLIDRLQETERADRARTETALQPLTSDLSRTLNDAMNAFQEDNGEDTEDALRTVWEDFVQRTEVFRERMIEDAASGREDAYSTIGNLDALRWLQRVAYHAWRIVHHVRRTRIHGDVPFEEEIPPHQEQTSPE